MRSEKDGQGDDAADAEERPLVAVADEEGGAAKKRLGLSDDGRC